MDKKTISRIVQPLQDSPFKMALIYVVVAALWIVSSSYLLPQTVSDPELQGIFEILKGLLFVLVTGILLYVILHNWAHVNKPQKERTIFEFKLWNRIRFLPATFTLVLLLPAILFLIYLLNTPALEREGLARLQSMANIQAIYIESWLKERAADANVLYHNRTLSEMVHNMQRTEPGRSSNIVNEHLLQLLRNYSYESIILLDMNDKPLLAVGEHTDIAASTKELIDEARKSGQIKHNHQFILSNKHLHTDYVIPLSPLQDKTSSPTALVIMRARLNDLLVQTSLTQTVAVEEDDVLLMSVNQEELVAFDTTTGTLHHTRKLSQVRKDLPAMFALRSTQAGTVITTDYRDISVLAAWKFIPGTDWFILAKTDRSKVMAPLWNTLGWVFLVGIFLTAAIIALLHILWSRHQYYLKLEQQTQEKQSDKLLKYFFDMPFVGMAIWSTKDGHWLRFNERLSDMLGYSRDRLQTMHWEDLLEDEDLPEEKEALKRIIKGKDDSYTVERRMRRIDGTHMYANIDVQCVRNERGKAELLVAIIQDISAYQLTIEALRESEDRFRTIFDSVRDGILVIDPKTLTLISANDAFCTMLGYSVEEIAGISMQDIHPKELWSEIKQGLTAAMEHEPINSTMNIPVIRNDGSLFYADIKSGPAKIGDREYILGVFRDTTERNEYEEQLRRLSQYYAALVQCNEAIIRSTDETDILQDICRISVQLTQVKAAWVGMIEHGSENLEWIAGYGDGNKEVASAIKAHNNDEQKLKCTTYMAIHSDEAIWVQNLNNSTENSSCLKIAEEHEWQSAASLPLRRGGEVVAVLNLYADIESAFDEDVQKLLKEMAFDISFALDNFVLERQRIESKRLLTESAQQFRGLVEQSLSGIYIIQNDQYVYANPRLAEILGFTSEDDIVGVNHINLVVPKDRDNVRKKLHALFNNRESHIAYEAQVQRCDGTVIDIGVHGALASHQGHPAIIGLVQDVTEKKQAEAQRSSYISKLQASLMQTVEVATSLSEMRDPYTAGHERRVAEIAVAIGGELGLDAHTQEGLRIAGHLHDIGKINIPSEILSKPSRLTDLEYEIIKAHPQSGYNVLKDVDFPWPVAQVALQHHERINGTGYPQGLKGEEILLEARITAVADVVEAMGSHRPYRPGLGLDPALNEIEKGMGTLYDQEVAEACLRLFREKGYSLPA